MSRLNSSTPPHTQPLQTQRHHQVLAGFCASKWPPNGQILPVAARCSMPTRHQERDQRTGPSSSIVMIQLPNTTPHPFASNPTPLSCAHWFWAPEKTLNGQPLPIVARCSRTPHHQKKDQSTTQSCSIIVIQLHNTTPHLSTSICLSQITSDEILLVCGDLKGPQRISLANRKSMLDAHCTVYDTVLTFLVVGRCPSNHAWAYALTSS
jgi:hypothetical protein